MKTLKNIFFAVLLAVMAVPAFGQTATTRTVLSSALGAGTSANIMTVLSTTGWTASTNSQQSWAYLQGELVQVMSISGTQVTVRRAQRGQASAHPANTVVWFGGNATFLPATGNVGGGPGNPSVGAAAALPPVFVAADPVGTCTRASNLYLPVINPSTGMIWDCILSTTSTTDQWMAVNLQPQFTSTFPSKRMAVTVATYTALLNDSIIGVNTNAATTITLPACTGCEGKWYYVMDMAGGVTNAPTTITISGSAGQLVNSGASAPIVASAVRNQGGWIFFDGVSNSWYIPRAAEDR